MSKKNVVNRKNKILPFPTRPEEPAAETVVFQVGNDRFAVHWAIEELPPAAPLLQFGGRSVHLGSIASMMLGLNHHRISRD